MDLLKKEEITLSLKNYCDKYSSQNRAANSLNGVSGSTISNVLNRKWESITDDMWRSIAAQTGFNENKWEAVETKGYKQFTAILNDAKENNLVLSVTGEAGSGKSFTMKTFEKSHENAYYLCCNDFWNRKLFLSELLSAMGYENTGYTVGEMMKEIITVLKKKENPLLMLDEVDKLSDNVLYFFITFYNALEEHCGIVLAATDHFKKRLDRGRRLNKKGYNEIWSRIGRKCIAMKGVTAADIARICEDNGVTDERTIEAIIGDSDGDLRRVRRRVHAELKKALKRS